MPSVNTYTLSEFGGCDLRWREVSDAEAAAVLESETAASEQRRGRSRQPHSSIVGNGFQIGTGDDTRYELVLLERF